MSKLHYLPFKWDEWKSIGHKTKRHGIFIKKWMSIKQPSREFYDMRFKQEKVGDGSFIPPYLLEEFLINQIAIICCLAALVDLCHLDSVHIVGGSRAAKL